MTTFPALDGCYVEEPALASNGKGKAWAVWLSRSVGDRDSIIYSEYAGEWSDSRPALAAEGRYESPRLACAPGGLPMLVWIEIDDGKWMLMSGRYSGDRFGEPVKVTSGGGKSANPCLIAVSEDRFWVAWESYDNGRFRILVKQYAEGAWGREIAVTDPSGNCYDPSLAVDSTGRIWIAYSTADEGHRKVLLTRLDPQTGEFGEVVSVAIGGIMTKRPNTNSYPSLWCDPYDRVWVAYEHDSRPDAGEGTPCYHGARECSVACFAGGVLREVDAQDTAHGGLTVLGSANDHYPMLTQDPEGNLWMFSRDSTVHKRGWNYRASCLNGASGWAPAVTLLPEELLGRLSRPAVAPVGDGSFLVAWQEDNYCETPDWMERLSSSIHIARVDLPEPKDSLANVVLKKTEPVRSAVTPHGRPRIERRQVTAHGEDYILLYGNMHEHSLISRCWVDCSEGTFDEDYRQAMDVEGYDFMAMTDHDFDTHIFAWQKTRRAAEFYNSGSDFVALPAYEWTLVGSHLPPSAGHRNIIFASDADAAKLVYEDKTVYGIHTEPANTIDKIWRLLREKGIEDVVTIPHHPADADHPMDWNYHDPEFQTVVEIFQWRESAEYEGCPRHTYNPTKHKGCYVQDALARGHRMGFVAGGEHNSIGWGATALLVREVSRKGILEALRSRRCYGTTGDKIFVDFRVDGHPMGEEFATTGKPRITGVIDCTAPIDNVVVFKNNQVIYERGKEDIGESTEYEVDFVDGDFSEDSYYYLRVIQADNQIAWSSPVWVDCA